VIYITQSLRSESGRIGDGRYVHGKLG